MSNFSLNHHEKKYSGLGVMLRLVRFVAPLTPIMCITITMGILGFLVAIGITVFGAVGIAAILNMPVLPELKNPTLIFQILAVLAVSRGVLRYLEQYSGHFIAFKLLAFVRDKIYRALRRLAPAKLDGKRAGKIISIITSDVELLEVFYAHTIAPIMIGILTSLIMVFLIAWFSPILSAIAFLAYLTIGLIIPYFTSKRSRDYGRAYREDVGEINNAFLESLYGMREIILFDQAAERQALMDRKSDIANKSVEKLKQHQGITKAWSETAVLVFSTIMLFTGLYLQLNGTLTFTAFLVSLIALMSSFGPVITLSNLSNNLLQTFASGERVLNLLEEKPLVIDQNKGVNLMHHNMAVKDVSFSYSQKQVLQNISLDIPEGKIIGIQGKSGSGKSTLLKLLMRFYDVESGVIEAGGHNITQVNTASLRENMGYVTQETYLFNTTIEENLRIANRQASMDDIIKACKFAAIHDFIEALPDGYQSKVGELGDVLSGGEQQRLGIARAFLHNSKIILLDEPTSNLDSMNENIILNSLKEHRRDKTIIIVSHRPSTLSICDKIYHMQSGRLS